MRMTGVAIVSANFRASRHEPRSGRPWPSEVGVTGVSGLKVGSDMQCHRSGLSVAVPRPWAVAGSRLGRSLLANGVTLGRNFWLILSDF